jgi:branched-chain amino acid transport system permease protein
MKTFVSRLNTAGYREAATGSIIVLGAILIPGLSGNSYWASALSIVGIYVIASVSTNLLRAESGQFSFGQGAIFGAAAYATALASAQYGWSLPLAMVLGVVIACLVGMLLALPALRVQGYYLAFVTQAAALVFPEILYGFGGFTHAISGVTMDALNPFDMITGALHWFSLVIAGFAVLALFGHAALRHSSLGRKMRAAAISPEAAQTLRIRPGRVRVAAFLFAALGAGIAGALYAPYFGFVSPDAFPVSFSVLLYFVVVVGGDSTIIGPLFGLFVLYVVPNLLLSRFADYRDLIYGVLAFLIMALLPNGIVPPLKKLMSLIGRREHSVSVDIPQMIERLAAQQQARAATGMTLTVDKITKRFRAVVALSEVSLRAEPGGVHALIGPNGCGKSTLLNVISGLVTPDGGTVSFDGDAQSRPDAVDVATSGVARGFQTPRIFDSLDAWDNVELAVRDRDLLGDIGWVRDALAGVPVSSFTHSERRWLELLRICLSSPRLVLLDEPAAGLSINERERLVELIRSLIAISGATVVLVEHDLQLVWSVADTVTVMAEGEALTSGESSEIRGSESMNVLVGGSHVAD